MLANNPTITQTITIGEDSMGMEGEHAFLFVLRYLLLEDSPKGLEVQ